MTLCLVLPYPPSANRYWRTDRGGLPHVSDEARAYKRLVRMVALRQLGRFEPLTGPVEVSFVVYRPRRVGDLDNLLKVTLDALKGIAFKDDSQVVALAAQRLDDKTNPRLEVCITLCAKPLFEPPPPRGRQSKPEDTED